MKMIRVVTSHNEIFQKENIVTDLIKEYQTSGSATIIMNGEGPDAEAIGLYKMLDYVCEQFNFNKKNIRIITWNADEINNDYDIVIRHQHWIQTAKLEANKRNFVPNKDVTKKLFGCLYNIPSWNRLCLLSYIKRRTQTNSLLACNVTLEERQHNTVSLDNVIMYAPQELYNVIEYLKTNPQPLPGHPGHKPEFNENMEIIKFYNDFFVDVVAETYTTGKTFFTTEKTFRPMLALTPFITYGPQGFLSNLRAKYGFQTFNQWWDESYDDYQQYERIKKIYTVIDFLDTLSISDRQQMYKDMQDTLLYNKKILDRLQ